MIITIDGPVATGKSTIAKKLALSLGYIYFDTGAMYRAITYGILKNKIDCNQSEALKEYLDKYSYRIRVKFGEKLYIVDGEDITHKIREEAVTSKVSYISSFKEVREKLVALQRENAKGVNAVFEGRDMGTVVFPDAHLKIFLTGKAEVRAKRRYEELIAKFPHMAKTLTPQKVLEEINERDAHDTSREISPLKKADDAHEIDTSNLTPEEIVYKILEIKDATKKRRR